MANWRNRVWTRAIPAAGLDAFGFIPEQAPSYSGFPCDSGRGRRARRPADAGTQRHEDGPHCLRAPVPDRLDEAAGSMDSARTRAPTESPTDFFLAAAAK